MNTSLVMFMRWWGRVALRIDREEKLHNYQMLESLQEHVLVAQQRMEVQIYRRTEQGWDTEIGSQGEQARLTSLGLEIPVESIYE